MQNWDRNGWPWDARLLRRCFLAGVLFELLVAVAWAIQLKGKGLRASVLPVPEPLAVFHLVLAAAWGALYGRRATTGTSGSAAGWFGMGAALGALTHVFSFVPVAALQVSLVRLRRLRLAERSLEWATDPGWAVSAVLKALAPSTLALTALVALVAGAASLIAARSRRPWMRSFVPGTPWSDARRDRVVRRLVALHQVLAPIYVITFLLMPLPAAVDLGATRGLLGAVQRLPKVVIAQLGFAIVYFPVGLITLVPFVLALLSYAAPAPAVALGLRQRQPWAHFFGLCLALHALAIAALDAAPALSNAARVLWTGVVLAGRHPAAKEAAGLSAAALAILPGLALFGVTALLLCRPQVWAMVHTPGSVRLAAIDELARRHGVLWLFLAVTCLDLLFSLFLLFVPPHRYSILQAGALRTSLLWGAPGAALLLLAIATPFAALCFFTARGLFERRPWAWWLARRLALLGMSVAIADAALYAGHAAHVLFRSWRFADHEAILLRMLANTALLSAPAWLVFGPVWRRLGRTDVVRGFPS